MFNEPLVAPSILSADFAHLGRDVNMIEQAGAKWVHVDVMDGHFVPNLSMGVPVVKSLKRVTTMPLDVHLMIDNPLEELPWFLDAGADSVTVHVEPFADEDAIFRALEMMGEAGVKKALSVKPKTPVEALSPFIKELDMVLVMSVEPGFSGQSYIEGSEDKVAAVVRMARAAGVSPLIQVDGGVGVNTVERVCAAGADALVCGSAAFGAADPAAAIAEIVSLGNAARLAALAAEGRA